MGINNKGKIALVFGLIIAIVVLIYAVNISTATTSAQQYDFPLQADEIKKVLVEQEIEGWYIAHQNAVSDSRTIFTLKNDANITIGIDAWVEDNHKILNMTWLLPSNEANDFIKSEIFRHFELPGILYGNKKGIDKALDEMLRYHLDEENFDKSLYWNNRVGNDHLKVQIKPMSSSENQVISLLIMPSEVYEDYLRVTNGFWKAGATIYDLKVLNSTVAELEEIAKESIPPVNEEDIFSKYFIVHGRLENIKENKKVPEQLMNINSSFLKPNKDKYLSAKLVDQTGNINVFVEMTSLNSKELGVERNHNVMMFYNNGDPIYVVSSSVLYTEELRVQEIARDFIRDLYTVSLKEVDNYKSILNIITSDSKELSNAMQINDEVLKSLLTDAAYDTLIKNRENLKFTEACYEGGFTMEIMEIQLSENKNKIENNEAGYNFELQLRYILPESSMTTDTAKGLIELDKIEGNWKVSGIDFLDWMPDK